MIEQRPADTIERAKHDLIRLTIENKALKHKVRLMQPIVDAYIREMGAAYPAFVLTTEPTDE